MEFQQINLYMPLSLSRGEINGYFVKYDDSFLNIYICESKIQNSLKLSCCPEWKTLNKCKILCVINNKEDLKENSSHSNVAYLEVNDGNVSMSFLKVNNEDYDLSTKDVFILLYDHSSFFETEDNIINKYERSRVAQPTNQFENLNSIVKHSCGICWKSCNDGVAKDPAVVNRGPIAKYLFIVMNFMYSYSNLCVQVECFLKSITWIYKSIRKEKRISVRTGNLLTSLLVDFLAGILIMYWMSHLSVTPVNNLYYTIELIVNYLQSLLQWLMGSPAGLKLNHAFNTMLGKFFLYHIGLWWMFLVIIKSFLQHALNIAQCLGLLGISFQTAILADLLSLSSFHVYCIYTYAARLYNIQISGLIALLRLFLGRKHNPLRGGVDSCQYNHHQLFVGTLAFTILLFLLPTTFLYYVVFTSLRVVLVLLGGFLIRFRYFVQSLPLYLIALWSVRSPRIAGDVKVTVNSKYDTPRNHVYLRVVLQTASLFHLISKYHPLSIVKPQPIQWKQLLSCLCHGYLLYPV